MKRYFINPELKMSSVILMTIIVLFLVCIIIFERINYESLKEDYSKSMGAIALRVIAKDPQLEKEIIPLITKEVSKEEAANGKNFLNQYGLNKKSENIFFPYINKTYIKNNFTLIFIFLALTILLFLFNYIQYSYFYDRIIRLTLAAKRVVEGEYDIAISEDREGDLSKLAIAFNSMREVIRNNISELKSEKQFLIDLLSDISHQLKTPLSSMILYNDIMLTKELSKEQRETFLLYGKNQLDKMNWLIKQILKLAKLDAKAIELNKENQSLNESIIEAIETLEGKAVEENINICFHEKEEVYFTHDRLWLEEALNNIIKNSIEHTPSGGNINIEVNESPIYKRIIIQDSGEGISEEDLPNIFKRFYKVRSLKKGDSIGIGLALAKSIIEAHDGIIDSKSKLGVGTEFTITFLNY